MARHQLCIIIIIIMIIIVDTKMVVKRKILTTGLGENINSLRNIEEGNS